MEMMKKRKKTIMIKRKENLKKKGYEGEVSQI